MATGNFCNKNASKIYACLMQYEQPVLDDDGNETEELEYVSPDSFEMDNFIESVQEELSQIKKYDFYKDSTWDFDRSYPGQCIGVLYTSRYFGDIDISIDLKVILRSAYYDGANLDWEILINNEYSNEEVDYFIENELENSEMNAGIKKIQTKNIQNWIEKTITDMRENVEKIFEKFSTPLIVEARFSNGETIYKKIE